MNKLTKQQKYLEKVLSLCEEGTTLITGEYKNAREPIELKCKHGHIRNVTTNNIVSKGGGRYCKECLGFSSTGKKLDSHVREAFKLKGFTLLEEYKGALTSISVQNDLCGHINKLTPQQIERNSKNYCPTCSNKTNYTEESFAKEISAIDLVPITPYVNMKTNLEVLNKTCEHIYTINPGHLIYDSMGVICPICANTRTSTKNRFFSKLIEANLELKEEYVKTQVPLLVLNNNCGHTYKVTPNNIVCAGSGVTCRICFPLEAVSQQETDLVNFIQTIYPGWVVTNDRSVLDGKELDIVLPDINLAIEYNGAYWHREDKVGEAYHLNKTEIANKEGYRLLHIFDWEWNTKGEIVKSRIKSILNVFSTKIYARNTEVREIPFPYDFLQDNHLQGAGTLTKYNFGLFHNNTLVAVMTFGIPRFNSEYNYELIRFCTLLDTKIIGGASKLLKAFQRKFSGSIISYSDRRWSEGGLYKQLGFIHKHNSRPNYKYIKSSQMLSRYQCTKAALKDRFPEYWEESKSETQIMLEAGWNKVFDSGNGVWVLN